MNRTSMVQTSMKAVEPESYMETSLVKLMTRWCHAGTHW